MDCAVPCELLRKLEELSDIVPTLPSGVRERYIYYLRAIVTVSVAILCEMGTAFNLRKKCGRLHYLDYSKLLNRLIACVNGRLEEKCNTCGIATTRIQNLLASLNLVLDRKKLHPILQISFKKTVGMADSERARKRYPELCTILRSFIFALYSGELEKIYHACIEAISQIIPILKKETEHYIIYISFYKEKRGK